MVRFSVVNIQFQRSTFVCLNQSKKILRFVKDRICSNDVIGETPKASLFCWTVSLHVQNMPNIFVGTLKGAEAYRYTKKALSTPSIARRNKNFSNLMKIEKKKNHDFLKAVTDMHSYVSMVKTP